MRILIFGLPGSGKTTLSEIMSESTGVPVYDADYVRERFNDWDFSVAGRLRQAQRMKDLASNHSYCIANFICPLREMRTIFNADYAIWMDTISKGRYDDTNQMFEVPEETEYDLRIRSFKTLDLLTDFAVKTGE